MFSIKLDEVAQLIVHPPFANQTLFKIHLFDLTSTNAYVCSQWSKRVRYIYCICIMTRGGDNLADKLVKSKSLEAKCDK